MGDATLTLNDIPGRNYTVSGFGTFKITHRSLKSAEVSLTETSYTYDGQAKTPGTDYAVTYSNNTNAGENTASVKVTGSKTATYTIDKAMSAVA